MNGNCFRILEIAWAEAYVAPIAGLLVLVGAMHGSLGSRKFGTGSPLSSSRWTHGAAVASLVGFALAERVAGGAGEHSLVVGGVAIVAGGARRLVGPLAVGTLLLTSRWPTRRTFRLGDG